MSNEKTVSEYTVGWICALPIEMAAAKAMLDEIHPKLPQASNDQNSYCLGSINGHNIAIACLPSGVHGTTSAATVASSMLHTFPSIKFGLMVGIGGGVPGRHSDKNDSIRLGDVVVSKPTNSSGGLLQYDLGKRLGNGLFQRTGALNKPPQVLLTAVSELQADHLMGLTQIPTFLSQITQKYPSMKTFSYPGKEFDELFEAEYEHVSIEGDDNDGSCQKCDKQRLVPRPPRNTTESRVHYGIIASGNQLIRDARIRDLLAQEDPGILCFEMEAAGLMDQFPCLVIRGISDYTDSHKSDLWQPYAASVAAAYAKELLSVISVRQIWKTTSASEAISAQPSQLQTNPLLQLAGLGLMGPSTPLHDAVSRGQHDVVKSLLEKGVPNINAQDSRGYTAMHIAVEQDDIVSAKALIEKGASTSRPNIMVQPVLKLAVQLGNEEMVKLLLDQGGNVNERDAIGYTPLVAAASAGNERLLTLLIQRGADLNARGSRGSTALHQASMMNHEGTLRLLLKAGARTDIRDISGRTPLQVATRLNRVKAKKVFAEENAVV